MAKIKMKTKKSLAKRVQVTASGKLKRKHAYRSHMAADKTQKQKRQLRKDNIINSCDTKRLRYCLHNKKK